MKIEELYNVVENEHGEVLSRRKIPTNKENKQYEIMSKINNRDILSSYLSDEVGGYVNLFFKRVDDISFLTESEKMRLIFFMAYTNYDSYMVIGKKGCRDEYLNKKSLMIESKMKTRTFNSTFKVLSDNGIIIEDEIGIKINKKYCVKGSLSANDSNKCARVFVDSVKELFKSCSAEKHKGLYYLFKLIPYVHVDTNIICSNQLEEEVERINSLNMLQICSELGYSKNHQTDLRRTLMDLDLKMCPVFGKFSSKYGNDKYMVNPRVFYLGKKYEHYNMLDKLFNL